MNQTSKPLPDDFTNRRGIEYEVAREQILTAQARISAALGWDEDELDPSLVAAYHLQSREIMDELYALDPSDYAGVDASIRKWTKVLESTKAAGAWTPTSHRV